MRNEYVISDFSLAVMEKERLSSDSLPDRWEVVPYETAEISGAFLVASELSDPEFVTVDPALDGWYRIYACMTEVTASNHIDLRLTDDVLGQLYAKHVLNNILGECGGGSLEMCGHDGTKSRDLQGEEWRAPYGKPLMAPLRSDERGGGYGISRDQKRPFPQNDVCAYGRRFSRKR